MEKLLAENYENSVTSAVLSSQDIKKCAEYLVSLFVFLFAWKKVFFRLLDLLKKIQKERVDSPQ